MNVVERIKNVLNFKAVDRLPMLEWGAWWNETLDRWYKEGLSREITESGEFRRTFDIPCTSLWSDGEIIDHLGLDRFRILWISPRNMATCPAPEAHGAGLIRNEREYEEFKRHLFPNPAFDRVQLKALAEQHHRGKIALWVYLEGFFWFPRTMFGIEPHLYAFYDHPELMHRMNTDLADYHRRVMTELCEICVPDVLFFAEDLSYNHGPMISKEDFDTFITPYYRQVIPMLESYGIKPMMDSDGDVTMVIPWAKEAGIRGIGPLERIAGVDVAKIRHDHPDFLLAGGFDKLVMKNGEAAMRREFERLLPVMSSGGYLPTADHQTPPEVSLAQYHTYIRLFHEYAERAAQNSK